MRVFDPKSLALSWQRVGALTSACLTGIIRLAFFALICSAESLP